MKRQVFRQEALQRLSSPEQLDLLMPVTSSRAWLALVGIGLLLVMGVVWAVVGSVETTVEGSGLLMRHQGFEWVNAPQAGQVAEVLVDADSQVEQGERLITLAPLGETRSPDRDPEPGAVRSPLSGRVLEVNVLPGSTVAGGEPLLSVESPQSPLQAVLYVPAADGFKIQPGMRVRVLPATAVRQGATFLLGEVSSVARFPATHAQMMYSLQNEAWVNDLLRLGPTLELVIDLASDEPLSEFYSGTPCEASIVVAERRPIEFLLPISSQ